MKKVLLILVLAASASAFAAPAGPIGHVLWSPIESIRINSEGLVTVYFTYPIYADLFTTGCRDDDMDHAFYLDANTDVGKIMLTVLLQAKASDLDVVAFGTGRCIAVEGSVVEILQFARVY
jgi:hypothetical protein